MAEALKSQRLTSLGLGFNRISAEGARLLAEALLKNAVNGSSSQTLTSLNLRENGIGASGARSMAEVLRKNTVIHLSSTNDLTFGHRHSYHWIWDGMESAMLEHES